MTEEGGEDGSMRAGREYAQLFRIQERVITQLRMILDELRAPTTEEIVKEVRKRTGAAAADTVGEVTQSVEQAIRSLKLLESETRKELLKDPSEIEVEGVPNLPAPLARFLAERTQNPRFSYEVLQDEVRGWVIRWKEYTEADTIRGSGQFYERPYAWIED